MQRRTFFGWLVGGVNGVIAFALGIPGVRYLLHPLREKSADRGFLPVAPLSSLTPGVPFRAILRDTRSDAYTRHPPGPIGGVWLVRRAATEGDDPVDAYQVVCPHLGCAVDYHAEQTQFSCPCHTSAFALDGSRLSGPSPRDMDALATRLSAPDDRGERWVEVRFERFRSGVVEQVPVA